MNDCKQETTSAWLASVLQFAFDIEFFAPFKAFQLKMKEVRYTIYQKLLTIIASILMGCESTKDINEILGSETLAANMLEMERFPDQSQINLVLKRMDEGCIEQLRDIHHQLFMNNSHSVSSDETVVIDFDQSGLAANARTYEFAEKGYFPHKRGKTGYQVSAAFAGKYAEVVEFYLDPGNTHCQERLEDLLSSVTLKYADHLKAGRLVIRADSGYGAMKNIEKLMAIQRLQFVVKGYSSRKAARIAKTIALDAYTQADDAAWVYELPVSDSGLRTILVQVLGSKGELTYTLLHTNISRKKMSAVQAFHFYNGRQTIEAFFKAAKNTYGIKNLRTSSFYGIYSFIWLVFMTHNLITWFRMIKLENTELSHVGVKTLVEKCSRIRGFVIRTANRIKIVIPNLSKLARLLLDALAEPDYIQLGFLI
jgi:hypothetical protein